MCVHRRTGRSQVIQPFEALVTLRTFVLAILTVREFMLGQCTLISEDLEQSSVRDAMFCRTVTYFVAVWVGAKMSVLRWVCGHGGGRITRA